MLTNSGDLQGIFGLVLKLIDVEHALSNALRNS